MKSNQSRNYFIGALITSFIGGVLFLVDDFSGWYYYNYYLGIEERGSIGFISSLFDLNPIGIVIFLIFAGFLFYCSAISAIILLDQNTLPPQIKELPQNKLIQIGIILSLVTAIVSLVGGTLFAITMIIEEESNWWFGTPFYAGILGGGLTGFLFFLADREFEAISKSH